MKLFIYSLSLFFFSICLVHANDDLQTIKKHNVLRHLGVPYANFVTGSGDGLSVEIMQLFAAHLGVNYQYVKTSWKTVIPDLIGKEVSPDGENVQLGKNVPIRGDVIANGLTILAWREKVLTYSMPTFPTQVWLITHTQSGIKPIRPANDIDIDIHATRSLIAGQEVLGKAKTCLDPSLYQLSEAGAKTLLFDGKLNELAPAVINRQVDTSILDVPDALVALEKWPGQILILGPISKQQQMGVAFRPDNKKLIETFNRFFEQIQKDGTYVRLVKKYYPAVFDYYPEFFNQKSDVSLTFNNDIR